MLGGILAAIVSFLAVRCGHVTNSGQWSLSTSVSWQLLENFLESVGAPDLSPLWSALHPASWGTVAPSWTVGSRPARCHVRVVSWEDPGFLETSWSTAARLTLCLCE